MSDNSNKGNSNKDNSDKIDRRVQRTKERLGSAMVELIRTKPFDSITVQDVLDKAEVSRSTFYSHYSDKNDLFVSDVDRFFERVAKMLDDVGEESERVAPVRELFAHLLRMDDFHRALVEAGRIHEVMDLGRAHLAKGIEGRLTRRDAAVRLDDVERTALAQALAGSFVSLMSWWIRDGMRHSPETMDDLFHGLVWNGVAPPE